MQRRLERFEKLIFERRIPQISVRAAAVVLIKKKRTASPPETHVLLDTATSICDASARGQGERAEMDLCNQSDFLLMSVSYSFDSLMAVEAEVRVKFQCPSFA